MKSEIPEIIEKWLDNFNSWETARNYNNLIKRMIRFEMVPDITAMSLKEFNKTDHVKIAHGLKTSKDISANNRALYPGVYSSLIRFIQVHQGLLCCVHECKRLVKKDKE